ncbi:MAG: hypothetical protein NVS2B16_13280 [Chloroflexota bacterium]
MPVLMSGGEQTLNACVARLICATLLAMLIKGVGLTSIAAAQGLSLSGDQLQQSLAVMKASLHQVHTVGFDSISQGGRAMRLRVTGDCLMKATSVRSHYRQWGTRFTQTLHRGMVPERYDREFVITVSGARRSSATWERDALKGNAWHRAGSNDDALTSLSLCPASDFFSRALQMTVVGRIQNRGELRVAGHVAWHLESVARQASGQTSSMRRTDLYVDRSTHFLVRMSSEIKIGRSYRYLFRRTFSKFNVPLTIQSPG